MLDELEIKLIKRLGYIPDALLERYLADKLTVKPDYPASVGPTEVKSRYEEYKANMKAAQKESNNVANPKKR